MLKIITIITLSAVITDGKTADASGITTVDEWEEYLRDTDSFCPSGDVSECPRRKRHICLDGKCFKQCDIGQDDQCADGHICNYEGLCKPEGCKPCIRNSMLPTPSKTAPPYNEVADIKTNDEWYEYLATSRNVCPGGDTSECNPGRLCLDKKCYKKCDDDGDCVDFFVCNWENLCKPEGCIPCQRETLYPTSQPPSDDIMTVIDGVKLNQQDQTFSTSMMLEIASLVCVIIIIFWICGGCMLWNINNRDNNEEIPYQLSTKYGSTETSSA